MKKIIATTTINPPTQALLKYAAFDDWEVIVAGDQKTKHDEFRSLDNVTYLDPSTQEKMSKPLSDLIGWNCLQRRNFAILEAYRRGADVIAVIDDDNIPYHDWAKDLLINQDVEVNFYDTDDVAFDSFGATQGYPHLWHRGFPLERIPHRDYSRKSKKTIRPKIQAIYWNGEPDVDAVCRMIHKPYCNFKEEDFPIASNKISPFNSQNSIIAREAIEDYFLFPYIGRMDDIWASFYCQAKGHQVVFTKPGVLSDRSLGTVGRYSIIEDMRREYLGMEKSLELLGRIYDDPDAIKNFLPEKSWLAFLEWKNIIK
jgi:hypothetical protein